MTSLTWVIDGHMSLQKSNLSAIRCWSSEGGQEYWISWRSDTSVYTHINVRANWIFMKWWRDFKKGGQVVKISTQSEHLHQH